MRAGRARVPAVVHELPGRYRLDYRWAPGLTGSMQQFARVRAMLRRQGNLIPDLDLLIASSALEHELTLLTRNRRHFERIPDLQLELVYGIDFRSVYSTIVSRWMGADPVPVVGTGFETIPFV